MGDFEKEMEALAAWPRHRPGTRLGLPGRNGLPVPSAKQTRPTPGKQSGGEEKYFDKYQIKS